MVKFFRCEKCDFQFFASSSNTPSGVLKCGAVVEYLPAENPEVGDEIIPSLGMKPIGCGGSIKEITEEEAMSHDRA